jgi:hypothetical protein
VPKYKIFNIIGTRISLMFDKITRFFNRDKGNTKEKQDRHPPFAWDEGHDGDYVEKRLSKYVLWFERQKEKDRLRERELQYTIIILGAAIPVINVIGIEQLATNILSAIFGVGIALLTAILQFEKYKERWMSHKVTATNLANEYFFWKNRSGAYGDLKTDEDRLAWLVNRCERMISAEVIEYVNPFASVKPGIDDVDHGGKTPEPNRDSNGKKSVGLRAE